MAHLWLQNKTFSLKMKKVLKKNKTPTAPCDSTYHSEPHEPQLILTFPVSQMMYVHI